MLKQIKQFPYYEIEDNVSVWEARWYQSDSTYTTPMAIVNKNTLGGEIVWSRISTGKYHGTAVGFTFKENTFIEYTKNWNYKGVAGITQQWSRLNETTILVETFQNGVGYTDNFPGEDSWNSVRITNQ